MENNFTAIDFETAHGKRWSIFQVGLVRVENGQIVNKINKLVCPPDNYYFYKNIEIHGITPNTPLKLQHLIKFGKAYNHI